MTLIEIINQIEADKIARHIEPHYAVKMEVIKIAETIYPIQAREIIELEIAEMEKQGKLRTGPTVNDIYFELLCQDQ